MENVVLIIHLLLALGLVAVVLMQRSEQGGLGLGGGGGGGGVMSGRAAATALGKLTWILAIGFLITSITLTVFARQNASGSSVIDRLGDAPISSEEGPALPSVEGLLPPAPGDNAPLVPQAD